MKPLNLKMQAFGPYVKPVEINFQQGLAGSNFFLIHGATGSGKTTILDAICYALFNKCSGTNRTGKMMRSEKAAKTDKTEVDFTFALGGKIYRVIRSPEYWRKSRRGAGYVEEKAGVAIFEDGKQVYPEKSEDYFESLLQFKADQFRQVVLLPQGEFRKFLLSSSIERGEILNVIFNASFYKLVETKLKELYQTSEQEFNRLKICRENLLENAKTIGNVDAEKFNDDSVAELQKNFNAKLITCRAEGNTLKILFETAAANLKDGESLNKDFEQFDKSAKNLQEIKKSLADAVKKFDAAQVEYDARKAEEPARRELERTIDTLKKVQTALDDLADAKNDLADAEQKESNAKLQLKKLEKNKIAYEKRLAELKEIVANLEGADVKFKDAQQKLNDAAKYQKQLNELARLKKELAAAQGRLETATKNFDAAQVKLNRLITLQRLGAAAKLAATLQDGEPCPVCGSTSHPTLAVSEEIIPTDEDIELAEKIVKRRQMEKDSAVNAVGKISGNVDALNDALKNFDSDLNFEDAQKDFDAAQKSAAELDDARKNLKTGESLTEELYKNLDAARANLEKVFKVAENLRGIVAEKKSQIPAEYLSDTKKISADLQKNQAKKSKLDAAFQNAEKIFQQSSNQKSTLEGSLKIAENVHGDAAKKIEGKVKPNIADLKAKSDAAQNNYLEKYKAVTAIEGNLKSLENIARNLKNLATAIADAEENHNMWKKLSETANGKLSFQRYYLNSMFQHVIREANLRLEKMSGGRYQFRNKETTDGRRSAGLDLEIFDANSGSCRDVATLSGGESFLASLSLALGLSAVVKNTSGGIKLDTIFIDEGFGSLDSETLDYAINTLIDLQSGGRLVGIISHVEELKQRVSNRLEITKHKDGSTAQFIV